MKPNKFSRAIAQAAALTAAALSVGSANAGVYQFYDGSTLYATMTTTNSTDFSLAVANIASGAFIDYLNLAGPGGTFTNTTAASITTPTFSYTAAGFTDQGKTYNWQIQFPNPNTSARLTANETATWSITPTANTWDFNLLHVNATNAAGQSIKLDSCELVNGVCTPPTTNIPEPGSLALVGLALLAGGVARRKLVQRGA